MRKKTDLKIPGMLSALALGVCLTAPVVFAEAETPENFGNSVLTGVEDLVKATKLPDLKKHVFEKYGVLFKPYFKQGFELSSNPFSAHSGKTDTAWTFTPGFQTLLQNKYGVIGAAYEATFKYFDKFSSQNTQDQSFLVYSDLFPSESTYLRVSDKFDQRGDTAGDPSFEPVDYRDNTVNVVAGIHQGDWTHEVGYENFDRNFQQDLTERYSYNENKYDYRLYRKLNDKMRVFAGGRLGFVDFEKQHSRDTVYFETPVGIEGTLPWYEIEASAAVGLHHRNVYVSDRHDWTNVVTSLNLQKTFKKSRTSVEGSFIRRPVESSFENATTYDEKMFYTGVKHLFTEKLRGRLGSYYSRRDFNERTFQGQRFQIGNALFVQTAGTVYRHDHIAGFNAGFDYHVRKWLIFHVDYNLTVRESNVTGLDYTENRLNLETTIPL